MSRELDPRFPPQQIQVTVDNERWVVIGYLPKETQQAFWVKAKKGYPDIVKMRRDAAVLIKDFNAVFQILEERYKQIMDIK